MRKAALIVFTIIILLIIASAISFTISNKPVEEEVESVSPVGSAIHNEMLAEEQPAEVAAEDENKPAAVEETSKISVIKKAVRKVQRKLHHEVAPVTEEPVVQEIIKKDEEVSEGRKFSPEEEELLKKVPRSEEVVVDKEIKLKSSGKYLFK